MPQLCQQEIGRAMVLAGEFEDLDDFASVAEGWDIDFRQLDRGPGRVQMAQMGTDRSRLIGFRFERSYEQRGSSPPGVVTFGLPTKTGEPIRWRSNPAPPGSIICFASGAEFEAVTRAGFRATTISFSVDHLTEIAEGLGLPEAMTGTDVSQLLVGRDPRSVDHLSEAVERLQKLNSLPSGLADVLDEEIPELLVRALDSGTAGERIGCPAPRERNRVRRNAQAFIEAHAHEAPPVRRICAEAGTSWRTLDYAFKEHFGVTPKTYLQAQRLHGVRRELRLACADTLIADVAGRWGFWHMGQFAADYRRAFNELPSETLLR